MIEVNFEHLALYVSRAKLFQFGFLLLEKNPKFAPLLFKIRQKKNELSSSV